MDRGIETSSKGTLLRASRWGRLVLPLLASACGADLAMPTDLSPRTYCASTEGLVHHYAWPWNDSSVDWSETALANSPPVGSGYCLTFRYHSETAGTFDGGGSFGAWFDIWDLGFVDTIPLWYMRDNVASGTFTIRHGMMWLTFERGGAFLSERPYLQHTMPDATGFQTAGTTEIQTDRGYLFLVLPWRRPAAAAPGLTPGGPGRAASAATHGTH